MMISKIFDGNFNGKQIWIFAKAKEEHLCFNPNRRVRDLPGGPVRVELRSKMRV